MRGRRMKEERAFGTNLVLIASSRTLHHLLRILALVVVHVEVVVVADAFLPPHPTIVFAELHVDIE